MYSRGNSPSWSKRFFSFFIFCAVLSGICFGLWKLEKKYYFFTDNHEYDLIIDKIARKHNIDPLLIKAVIWRESKFDVLSRGGKGEIGLMQIMPKSATRASVVEDWERATGNKITSEGNLFYPETNIDIGTWYLSKAIKHWPDYKFKEHLALCEYNAGKGNVNKWIRADTSKQIPPLEKDQSILKKVTSRDGNTYDRVIFPSTKLYVQAIMVKYHYYRSLENE